MVYKINNSIIDFIKREIENHIYPSNYRSNFTLIHGSNNFGVYSRWFIGITNETNIKKIIDELQINLQPLHFKYWNIKTKSNALTIEKYFRIKGMQGKKNPEAKASSKVVFILKQNKNLFDIRTI